MKNMPTLPTEYCTGCSACVALCPVGAITMAEDREGFLRPVVDHSKCIKCGKCEKYCHVLQERSAERTPIGVYAAKAADEEIHSRSQSGGVFCALAEAVLSQGGAVYGAALNENFETNHIRVTDRQALGRLQGVKYVQSRLGDSYTQAGEDLKKGTAVLFSGTPCQVAGLYSYLQGRAIPTDKLLTADLVCYGVPSPGVFRQWVKCLEKAHRGKLTAMQYRRTDALWGKGKELYRLDNGKVLEGDYYTKLYFRNLIIRPGCERCRYCNVSRPADLTLGDFWGIDKAMPDFFDDRGVSLVLVNTQKGSEAFAAIAQQLQCRQSTLEQAVAAQPRLQGIPVKASAHRAAFWETYYKKGMAYIAVEEGFLPADLRYRVTKKLEAVKGRFGKG